MMTPQSLRRKPPPPPKGFFTTAEWAKKWKMSIAQTSQILNRAMADKLVRRIRHPRLDGGGVRPCNFYGEA
jgi:hypothetical protein